MTGINSVLKNFYRNENRITPSSIWSSKIEEARENLHNPSKIHYLLGYPQDAEPTFYIFCETVELMEHTKDWLNCALPKFYCQYARPCKEAQFQFESSLLEYSPHGFLKVAIWSQQRTGANTEEYRKFIKDAVSVCQLSMNSMIQRYHDSPNIRKESDKPIGMLIKAFMLAYQDNDLEKMAELYNEIVIREDIERRNKDTLKFMRLEKEQKWEAIIDLAHERNVSAQMVSSGVTIAIINALLFTSCENMQRLDAFEINWPNLYVGAQEFSPLLIKTPIFESEMEWRLWAMVAHAINIEDIKEIVANHVEKAWLDKLMAQDTTLNAEQLQLNEAIDLSQFKYDEPSITIVLSYAQTCHESEVINIYEWVEGTPLPVKMAMKSQPSIARMWQQLESNATSYFQKCE